jgi:hypothetical protein
MEDDYFIGIYDPLDVRRNILESSRHIIKSLECHDTIEKIRHEKVKSLKEMRKVMSELELLSTKLKQRMPKTNIRKIDPERREDGENFEHIHTKTKFSQELKKLEEQLRGIEKELTVFK